MFHYLYKVRKHSSVGFFLTSYFVLLFNAGEIIQGILYADLFLPVFFIYFIFGIKNVEKKVLITSIALLFYTVFSSVISILFFNNSFFYAFALTARTAAFLLMMLFGFCYKSIILDNIYKVAVIVIISVAVVTLLNINSGHRAYYGYVQIVSTNAPAVSGFTLSAMGLFLMLISAYSGHAKRKRIFFLSALFSLFALFTYSLSAFVSLLASMLLLAILFMATKKDLTAKLSLMIGSVFGSVVLFLNYDSVISTFYRLNRLFPKLEYRQEKVDQLTSTICSDFSCFALGAGPGAHSFYNKTGLGEGSILAFDQLHGRLLLEWGLVGSFLWMALILAITTRGNRVGIPVAIFVGFGLLYGFGSEFIFVSYSGQLYGLLLGVLSSIFLRKNSVMIDKFRRMP